MPESALPRAKDNPKLLDVPAGLRLIGCENPDELWNYRFPPGTAASRLKQVIAWERTGGPSGGCCASQPAPNGQSELTLPTTSRKAVEVLGEGEGRESADGAVPILQPIPGNGKGQVKAKPDHTVRVLSTPSGRGLATIGDIVGMPAADAPNTELARQGKNGRILMKESLAKLGLSDAKMFWATRWPTHSAAHALRMAIMAGVRTSDPAVEGLGIGKEFIDEHQKKRSPTPASAA